MVIKFTQMELYHRLKHIDGLCYFWLHVRLTPGFHDVFIVYFFSFVVVKYTD